jgi:hypothetical protein
MSIRILPRRRSLIPSTFVIRALAEEGDVFTCSRCEERMFVRPTSGLCPRCFNARPLAVPAVAELVPDELLLEDELPGFP